MELQSLAAFGDQVPLSQCKRDDTISVLSFSQDGSFLASGDQAGRVVIFKLNPPATPGGKQSVSFAMQLHAHKSNFDFFRSELSEMKINSLKWLPISTINPKLLTCNSHEVKLWDLSSSPKIAWNAYNTEILKDNILVPTARSIDSKYYPVCKNTFVDIQTEYLVDLQCLDDQQTFLMVDVGCIKLWDYERNVKPICTYQISQSEPEITSSALMKNSNSQLLVGDDFGIIKLLDLRQAAEDVVPTFSIDTQKFASAEQNIEGVEAISSIASMPNDKFVVRRFGDLQVYDIRNPNAPLAKTDVQWFRGQMDYLIGDDIVKDTFRTTVTSKGRIMTGLYSADFVSWDWENSKLAHHRAISSRTPQPPPPPGRDFGKRVTCCEAHPTQEIVAVVSTAALFLFNEKTN